MGKRHTCVGVVTSVSVSVGVSVGVSGAAAGGRVYISAHLTLVKSIRAFVAIRIRDYSEELSVYVQELSA